MWGLRCQNAPKYREFPILEILRWGCQEQDAGMNLAAHFPLWHSRSFHTAVLRSFANYFHGEQLKVGEHRRSGAWVPLITLQLLWLSQVDRSLDLVSVAFRQVRWSCRLFLAFLYVLESWKEHTRNPKWGTVACLKYKHIRAALWAFFCAFNAQYIDKYSRLFACWKWISTD